MNTHLYIKQFKKLPVRTVPICKHWYKHKFRYRLEFRLDDWFQDPDWLRLLMHLKANDILFKKRVERTAALFINDETVLDLILNDDLLCKKVVVFEYTDLAYTAAIQRLTDADIANDVKFVKLVPEMDYILRLGNFQYNERELFNSVIQYIKNNRESFRYDLYTEVKLNQGHLSWQEFTFYTNNLDQVMMLHLMAPGKVRKVIKMISKEEKNELISSTSTD